MGITAYALPISIVYAEVSKINSPPPLNMKGAKVGCLEYRDYEAFMIAKNGGLMFTTPFLGYEKPETLTVEDEIIFLIDKLRKKEIDGFVLDQYTFWTSTYNIRTVVADMISHHHRNNYPWILPVENPSMTVDYYLHNTVITSIPYTGPDQLTYGALVKDHSDYVFL